LPGVLLANDARSPDATCAAKAAHLAASNRYCARVRKQAKYLTTKEKTFSNRNKKAMFAEIGTPAALRRRSRFCYPHTGDVRNVGHTRKHTQRQRRKHGEVAQGILG
jgi:hypothetical protein